MKPYQIIDVEQGTDEWFQARLGKITASVFDKVVTKTGKPSSQVDDIVNRAVAEVIVGEPDETFQSDAMLRGKDLEEQALRFFNYTHGYGFKSCGFLSAINPVTGEELGFGCSPDGLDEYGFGLELKCPLAHTHLGYLASGKLPDKYKMQVQGALMITGFKKWIFGSYHPELPSFAIEVERDEKIIEALREHLTEASQLVQKKLLIIREKIGDVA